MQICPTIAENPEPISIINCIKLGMIKSIAISGIQHMLEKTENENTMNIPFTPLPVIFLTKAYAVPAISPPMTPIIATTNAKFALGFTTNIAPINATTVVRISIITGFSCKIIKLIIIAKKGLSLFNIEASAIFIWSIA